MDTRKLFEKLKERAMTILKQDKFLVPVIFCVKDENVVMFPVPFIDEVMRVAHWVAMALETVKPNCLIMFLDGKLWKMGAEEPKRYKECLVGLLADFEHKLFEVHAILYKRRFGRIKYGKELVAPLDRGAVAEVVKNYANSYKPAGVV